MYGDERRLHRIVRSNELIQLNQNNAIKIAVARVIGTSPENSNVLKTYYFHLVDESERGLNMSSEYPSFPLFF